MSDRQASIDWEDAKRRLRTSEQALQAALSVSPERLEEVYRRRAAELAQKLVQEAATTEAIRVLVFTLGKERYALEIADLVELVPFANVTPVPEGPAALLGVFSLHEEIRSVVDLGRLMELSAREPSAGGYVVVLRKHGFQVALRVNSLDAICPLRPDDLLAPGSLDGETSCRYVRAVTRQKVQLLATDTILAHPLFGKA